MNNIDDILKLYQIIVRMKELVFYKKIYFEGGDDYQIFFYISIEANNKPHTQPLYWVALEEERVVQVIKRMGYYGTYGEARLPVKDIDRSVLWYDDLREHLNLAAEKTVEVFDHYHRDINHLLIQPLKSKIIQYL